MEEQTQSTTPPIIPPAPKSKKRLSAAIKILIIVLILLIVGGAGAYFLNLKQNILLDDNITTAKISVTPIADSTANWKIYENAKYNYTIKYSSEWSFREFPDSKDGAAFNPSNMPGYPDASESIDISVGQKNGNNINDPFEEYVKIAATQEIQNYNKLASIKKVTTDNGIIGHQTTWMVQPISRGGPPESADSESLPITYFEVPNNKNLLVRVSLNKKEDLAIYEKMLTTFTISPVAQVTLTPTPTTDTPAMIEKGIKEALFAKYNSNSFVVMVSEIEGNYAKGGVSDEGGGGLWFGTKVDGKWKLIWDGNGIITCSDVAPYPDLPLSMLPECYNDKTDQIDKR